VADATLAKIFLTHFRSMWVKILQKICGKSAKNGQFREKVMKNMHYGPISQKSHTDFF
jgi:hypothetical protein